MEPTDRLRIYKHASSRRQGAAGSGESNPMKERTRQPPDEPMPQAEKLEESPKGRLSRDIQRKIGQQLRAMYTDVVSEGVPDRFAELLRRLDEKEKQ
jgi:hypothetical protein